MIADPGTAPPRPELTFLRRRSKPRPTSPAVADFVAGRVEHPPRGHGGHPPEQTRARSSSLDLDDSAPAPAPAAPSPAHAVSNALDLTDAPPPSATAAPGRSAPTIQVHDDRRIRAGGHHLLTVTEPTVTLTRVQSGIGQLEIEAVCSAEIGDLRIGAAYQLRDGTTSTVQFAGDRRFAPSMQHPVIVAGRDEYEHLRIDLRRCRELERLAVYAFSESRVELTWGGTLVVTTYGNARIELPLETLHRGSVAVLLSIYNLDGELVIRAEMETVHEGDIREATRAYGYDRITWRDDRAPAD